jgi:SAM-dependent methyltransferase
MDFAPVDATDKTLVDIARINRWFGGQSLLKYSLRSCDLPSDACCLDVGSASGDMARVVAGQLPQARIVALDIHPHHLQTNPFLRVAGDGFGLPFPDRTFDLVYCSLFLHHFPDSDVVKLLSEFRRVSRHSVIAIDLHRNALAVRFLPATQWLFGWQPMTVFDGSSSVASSFRGSELADLAHAAGLENVRTRLHHPWMRWTLTASV